MAERDTLFAGPLTEIAGFRFDANVVNVFPDMIRRSVPGYETIVAMTRTLAERYVQDDSNCYDLGCSLGASTLAIAQGASANQFKIIAIDSSPAMIDKCKIAVGSAHENAVDFLCADICDVPIENASMVVLNFTLQFIAPQRREALLNTIYQGLLPNGILVLSEKIAFADPHLHQLMIELHHAFKADNGYSELEISQKRNALENVLIPESLETHRARLGAAGFSSTDVWFQCFNFASMLAIK